jgi:peptidoglycan/xylan/chitin deacetylase (PgdA/CDA1 family)
MIRQRSILMSFDAEEFDMPLEYGDHITIADQMDTGYNGLLKIKEVLAASNIPVTLFTTANFAENFPAIIKELSLSHEIASHTYYHSSFETPHLKESRLVLEKITGKKVTGLRMPRMKKILPKDVIDAGYRYDSSLNPTWLPGRYNNLDKPRRAFVDNGLPRIPASVSLFLRVPLFWLSFKNLSYSLYLKLVLHALRKDGYVCLYFHPWEFVDLGRFKMPGYTKKPCGDILLEKLERLIIDLKKEAQFITMDSFVNNWLPGCSQSQ